MLDSSITRTAPSKTADVVPVLNTRRGGHDSKKGIVRRANRLSWLVVEGQTQGFHCVLREFSTDGAQLTVSGLMGIPERFFLYVEPDSIKLTCSVTLRKGNSVRVRFTNCEENVRYRDLANRR